MQLNNSKSGAEWGRVGPRGAGWGWVGLGRGCACIGMQLNNSKTTWGQEWGRVGLGWGWVGLGRGMHWDAIKQL